MVNEDEKPEEFGMIMATVMETPALELPEQYVFEMPLPELTDEDIVKYDDLGKLLDSVYQKLGKLGFSEDEMAAVFGLSSPTKRTAWRDEKIAQRRPTKKAERPAKRQAK